MKFFKFQTNQLQYLDRNRSRLGKTNKLEISLQKKQNNTWVAFGQNGVLSKSKENSMENTKFQKQWKHTIEEEIHEKKIKLRKKF